MTYLDVWCRALSRSTVCVCDQ